ncbi:MAG TPA: cytochrome c biogenesis protein CcsA [Opitutaceae bacterium]|jgi:ABC-type transport system involved in cytochrome c biogenesis permease subunit|nr:cytochrome c biogenesis protein CcsA [Opitutaceae bacterium]
MKKYFPYAVLLIALIAVGCSLFPPKPAGDYNLDAFARLPVLADGRLKPFDTVARTALLELQHRQRVVTPDNRELTPTEWLLDVLFRADLADHYQHFRIDNPDVISLFGLQPEDGAEKKLFSFAQLSPKLDELQRQATLASQVDNSQQSAFERAVLQLQTSLELYQRLKYSMVSPDSDDFLADLLKFQQALPAGIESIRAKEAGKPHDEAIAKQVMDTGQQFDFMEKAASLLTVPPDAEEAKPDDWQSTGHALLGSFADGDINPYTLTYAGIGHTWRFHQPEQFNELVKLLHDRLQTHFAPVLKKCDLEARFNAADPFYTAMILYVFVFLFAIISWLKWPEPLGRAAFYLMAIAFVLATAGILTRMWLEGRPPVTNLYSSALFIGWGAVGLCLVLEKLYRNAIGTAAGGVIGFGTLIIAHHLSLGGDTMEMMRAVLDSNFWLATHVVVVTTGYASTFLAGFLALIYILRGLLTKSLDKATADSLARMVYGITCFATLFSFVGTILGGIWADQSWGRFWGWDPKENGALIIVLWNAVILHARWGGLVKQRGLMCLAVFGNIVTSWSWFGVNMLGVGLHSYGFTQATFWWLIGFVASQLAIIALANLPLDKWRSFSAAARAQIPNANTQTPKAPA